MTRRSRDREEPRLTEKPDLVAGSADGPRWQELSRTMSLEDRQDAMKVLLSRLTGSCPS